MAIVADVVFDLSTHLARRLAVWSARRIYPADPDRAATRAKKSRSVIEEAPRILAMYHALLFTGPAMGKTLRNALGKQLRPRMVYRAGAFTIGLAAALAVGTAVNEYFWLAVAVGASATGFIAFDARTAVTVSSPTACTGIS